MKKQYVTSALPIICLYVLLGSIVACKGRPTDLSPPQNTSNRFAWRAALKAEDEPTFREMRFLLSQINMSTVSDPDLKEVIEYQERLCNFCIEAGVRRDAKMNIKSMLATIDYKTVASTLTRKGVTKAPAEAARLVDEGAALYTGYDKYFEVRLVVANRYL
ncbi:MAG: hypothetical protein WCJ35_11855 [Planctomycetota bacterium]